jgi:hypothetical protein
MLVANWMLLIFVMTKRAVFDTNKIFSRKSDTKTGIKIV